ncbi:uncharacterized protein LOC119100389 [Pollicipes pollicipes]|uniref:uncharacterized protein LOC119100389 n=1 Tax=Pollicipes pollicipes TaxID=41117 RepID=UPI00188588A5|nr:uncharacterized protein LOC119100389 [Pollicipes pollicipes]
MRKNHTLLLLLATSGLLDGPWQAGRDQADPRLLHEIQRRLEPPSRLPYNLSYPRRVRWGQSHQVYVIQALTRNKTGGFFVESGAYDGEHMTNSLLLERTFGWSGVLIEPAGSIVPALRAKRRKAWVLQACLSHLDTDLKAMFRDEKKWGLTTVEDGMTAERLSDLARQQTHPNKLGDRYPVPCYPLYSILLALGRTSVDFLSLDVEGTEMGILAHVPWHLVDIKILLVENFMTYLWNPQTDMMRWFMESRGYLAMRLQHDWLFVRRDCEYAADAADIVRRARRHIAKLPDSTATDPFND